MNAARHEASTSASFRPSAAGAARLALPSDEERVSLCEVLDRVLNKGVVIAGDIVISVADVDLIYLGLQVVLTSVETMNRIGLPAAGVHPSCRERQG
jgi:hypothetical protein